MCDTSESFHLGPENLGEEEGVLTQEHGDFTLLIKVVQLGPLGLSASHMESE